MHWLIPSVSHAVSCLIAWQQQNTTLAALLLSIPLAATQSIHLWNAFYSLFAVAFLVQTTIHSRADKAHPSGPRRGPAQILALFLIPAALVPLHQYYLGLRLANVPWFHITRAPAGCLPTPSRTFTQPFNYGLVDVLGNQLPYAVVSSYVVAVAQTLCNAVRTSRSGSGSAPLEIIMSGLGALMTALVAAYGLPICGADDRDGTHQVAMHMDRSVDWNERTSMDWPLEARYGWFVGSMAVVGTIGVLLTRLTSVLTASLQSIRPAPTLTARSACEKAALRSKKITEPDVASRNKTSGVAIAGPCLSISASLWVNLLLTTAVVACMALYSWSGPRAPQEAGLPGLDAGFEL